MQKDLTEMKIFQRVLGWLHFLKHPVYEHENWRHHAVEEVVYQASAKNNEFIS